MKVVFYFSTKDRERELANSFVSGVKICCDAGGVIPIEQYKAPDADVAVVIGVKSLTNKLVSEYKESGRKVIFIDKGHLRREAYWRVSISDFMPCSYLMHTQCKDDRLNALSLDVKSMRTQGSHIVFAGASAKYHICRGLPDVTEYAQKIVHELQVKSSRLVVYRPKPSWLQAVPVSDSFFSRPPRTLEDEMKGAWALVTYASNAAVEAAVEGLPVVVLGDGVAKVVGSDSIDEIESVHIPSDEERWQWLCNVSYCQWTLSEFRSGEAWDTISDQVRMVT